jgi:hypothetical protein
VGDVSGDEGLDSDTNLGEHSDRLFFVDPVLLLEILPEISIAQLLNDVVILFILEHFNKLNDVL